MFSTPEWLHGETSNAATATPRWPRRNVLRPDETRGRNARFSKRDRRGSVGSVAPALKVLQTLMRKQFRDNIETNDAKTKIKNPYPRPDQVFSRREGKKNALAGSPSITPPRRGVRARVRPAAAFLGPVVMATDASGQLFTVNGAKKKKRTKIRSRYKHVYNNIVQRIYGQARAARRSAGS